MTPTNIKKISLLAVCAVALAGGGYAAGRYAAPDKVVYQDKIVEKSVDVSAYVTEIMQLKEQIKTLQTTKDVAKDVHVRKVTVKAPDGTVTTTTEKTDTSKTKDTTTTTSKTTDQQTKVEVKIVERLVLKDHEVFKSIERARPAWSISLMPGFDFAGALGHGTPYTLLPSSVGVLKHAIVGFSIEHRLIGPLSTGVWGNSAGMGGITIRLEF